MVKDDGAFLTIGELARELGVAQHILRYWESRFPQLRPLQRSGNRRYYRPADVELAQKINRLLNQEGFTVKGAQRALASRSAARSDVPSADKTSHRPIEGVHSQSNADAVAAQGAALAAPQAMLPMDDLPPSPSRTKVKKAEGLPPADLTALITRLTAIRENLEQALNSR
jgi:DNA-binding transcriptional MerR regulator